MKGVKYLYDDKGVPEAVLIDLKKNRDIWEDFEDLVATEERRNEPRESIEEVHTSLAKKRKEKAKK